MTSLCSPAAHWCALKEAKCPQTLANQPSSSSPASQVIARTLWPPTLACCVQSWPTTPMTHCSCHPTAALSLVSIFKEHCAAFLRRWGCPQSPHCTGCKDGARRQRIRPEQTSWPSKSIVSGTVTLFSKTCRPTNSLPPTSPRQWSGRSEPNNKLCCIHGLIPNLILPTKLTSNTRFASEVGYRMAKIKKCYTRKIFFMNNDI